MINLLSPFSTAIEKTSAQLFKPFRMGKWFALGFSAWLASFLSGALNFSGNYDVPPNLKNGDVDLQRYIAWGLPTWIGIVLGAALVIWLLSAVFMWLGCRGHFIFLDNTLNNRSEIKAPWRAFRKKADSLFVVHLVLMSVVFIAVAAVLICSLVMLWPQNNVESRPADWSQYLPLIVTGSVTLLLWVAVSLVLFFLRDFGALWMYRHDVSAWEALRKVTTLATQEPLSFLLYLLMRIAIGVVFLITAMMLGCATCCVGFLPYIGTVLTLPLWVFLVWYIVGCFAQFGPEYDVQLTDEQPPVLPPVTVG